MSINQSQIQKYRRHSLKNSMTSKLYPTSLYVASVLLLISVTSGCPDNCLDCDQTEQFCFACSPGYELSVESKCIPDTTYEKCIVYGPSGNNCFACQPTYTLVDGQCSKVYDGCVNKNPSDNTCYECSFGTNLFEGICLGSINCKASESICSECDSGFTLQNQLCVDESEGCLQIDQTTGTCQQCADRYDYVGYKCIARELRVYDCYIYNNDGICKYCKNGFVAFEGQCLLPYEIAQIQSGEYTLQEVLNLKALTYGEDQEPAQDPSSTLQNQGIQNCQVLDPQNSQSCLICVYGYYPSGNQCLEVSPFCDGHNVATGSCFACLFGLQKTQQGQCVDNNCALTSSETGLCQQCTEAFEVNGEGICTFADQNCLEADQSRCIECVSGYYPTIEGRCEVLPVGCQFANIITGDCLQCLDEYETVFENEKVACVEPRLQIQNCQAIDQVNRVCALCIDRYYQSSDRKSCLPVSPLCNQYNSFNGQCISCIENYELNGQSGQCKQRQANQSENNPKNPEGGAIIVIDDNASPSDDQNCLQFDTQSQTCAECSNRYYVDTATGKCVPVNPLCQTHDQFGACQSCYQGYTLSGTMCVVRRSADPYCSSTSENGVCLSCYSGYFLNSLQSKCQPLNPLCKTSNMTDGACLDCYPGYTLSGISCKVFIRDPNCRQYSNDSQCIGCSVRFYLSTEENTCKQVSALCDQYDQRTGICLTCFSGYSLSNGECVIAQGLTSSDVDLNCELINANTGACTQCFSGYYISSGRCVIKNLICKAINNQTGACTQCYPGYLIQGTTCVLESQIDSTDVNCKERLEGNIAICVECYEGYYVDPAGRCGVLDPLCKEHHLSNGTCSECYSGYVLIRSQCHEEQLVTGGNSDPFCVRVLNTECLECNTGYFLALNNVCVQVNTLCKTYDESNGHCLTCYSGYVLNQNTCAIGQDIYIPFCKQTKELGKCVECIDRYYLNQEEGLCTPVSILCEGYDKLTGHCTSCISGYVHQEDICVFPAFGIDPFCTYYENSYCTECQEGYELQVFVCVRRP